MAGPYYVDYSKTGGSNTGGSWTNAYLSVYSVPTMAAGEICYIAHNHVEPNPGAAKTITGSAASPPSYIISVTQDSNPPAYAASATAQINTAGGAYAITFDGSFAMYGVKVVSGANIVLGADANEATLTDSCTFCPGANGQVNLGASNATAFYMCNDTVSLAADSGASAASPLNIVTAANVFVAGMTYTNASNRNGIAVAGNNSYGRIQLSGCDFSGLSSVVEWTDSTASRGNFFITNCVPTSGSAWLQGSLVQYSQTLTVTNSGTADDPGYMSAQEYGGTVTGNSAIYRSGGATVEGAGVGWLITTIQICSEGSPFYTPWIYGTVTAGTKTFTVYGSCNNAGVTTATPQDDEVWLEVEYLAAADVAKWTRVTDHRVITDAAADQTTETSSTWVGLNDAGQGYADFRFKLECASVSVGEAGQYRARVAVGITSLTSASYFYIDPSVTVT